MKNTLQYILSIIILSILFCDTLNARNSYSFIQIGLKQGMPSYVNYVFEESNGVVWLDTSDGIIRYDGLELKKYFIPSLESEVSNRRIFQIVEDKNKQLWFLSTNGILIYSKEKDDFIPYYLNDGKSIVAGAVCEIEDGLLFGVNNKLYKYSYETKSTKIFSELGNEIDFSIKRMVFWDNNTIVCSNRNNKVVLYDIEKDELKQNIFLESNNYSDLCIDNKGFLWITDYNNGVKKIARDGSLVAQYTSQNSNLSSDLILCMTLINDMIWIGTDGGGVNIINPENGNIQVLKHESGNIHTLPVNTILNIHGSRKGNNIWLATTRGGLINARLSYMITYSSVALGNNNGLSENTVLTLYQEPDSEYIWIGTDGGGINRLDEKHNSIKHYPTSWGDKIVSICKYSSTELLVSIFSKGLFFFNKETGEKRPFELSQDKLSNYIKYSRLSTNLYNETENNILLLTNPVVRYNVSTGMTEELINLTSEVSLGMLCYIGKDSLYSYFHNTQTIYKIPKAGKHIHSIFHSDIPYFINSVSIDYNGVLWIVGTKGLYTYINGELSQIKNSLFKEAKSVLCDERGRVWIGAGQELFAYYPSDKKFILYGESDGVLKNEYLQKPKLLSNSERIYLGGVNGLLSIESEAFSLRPDEMKEANVVIMELSVGGINMMNCIKNGEISLPWNSRNIKIRFLVEGDDILRPRQFHYILDSHSDNAFTSYNSELNIPSLASGTYPIMVSYTKKDGGWAKNKNVLTLIILPPWYKSWWFIMIMSILFLFIVLVIIVAALRKKDRRVKWMLKEHEQKIYEEKVRFLINISHELRTPLTLIYAPLKKVIDSIQPSDRYFRQLNIAFHQAQRMKDLISMVLDARKMEMTMTHLDIQSYDLNQWIEEVSSNFVDGEDKTGSIELQLDNNIGKIGFDKDKCMVILSNLLMNAIKHSPQDSKIIIRTELTEDEKNVRISVSDQGVGLKNVDTEKLFVRFYQGDKEHEGTGIGLSYSKILVELHKGKIGAYNNPDKGATFYFELPTVQNISEEIPQNNNYLNELLSSQSSIEIAMPDKDKIKSINLKDYVVLIVDDNSTLVNYLAEDFKEQFKRVLIAYDGEQAYKMICKEFPDIVVSDVMMPIMNGYELCKAVKENISVSHIPFILLTARNDEDSRQYGYMMGADSYLEKPFEIEELLAKVVNKLYNRIQTKRHYQQIGNLPVSVDSDLTRKDTLFMDKLNQTIIENLDNTELDIPYICNQIGMSRASLYNKLKAITDMGANDYINKIRIEQAMKLIRESDLNFNEISDKVGFASARYFSTSFKQYTGVTPTQYKKHYINENLQ
ncbi:response regulator [uncultured Bacteroides sp.]|uniref:response regulator n=1 Tax=uncultured Bacteroides sp. TaxID=162156 RepID=UPI0026206070|nr:response regulator [uncultured Bacteroides sp.]